MAAWLLAMFSVEKPASKVDSFSRTIETRVLSVLAGCISVTSSNCFGNTLAETSWLSTRVTRSSAPLLFAPVALAGAIRPANKARTNSMEARRMGMCLCFIMFLSFSK